MDAHPDEEHRISIDTTNYPIESGSSGTDNAVKLPDKLSLEGWVSDLFVASNAIVDIPGYGRSTEAWGRIRFLAENLEPLTVVTRLQTYENMMIKNVHCAPNEKTGKSLRFRIDLEEVIFAQTRLTKLPPSNVDQDSEAADKTSTVDFGQKQSIEISDDDTDLIINAISGT